MTKNATWLQSVWPFFDEMSQYWVSRATANTDGSFSINDVLPPDEYADHSNDSFFTNVGASLTLNETLRWAALLRMSNVSRFASYATTAARLRLPFDIANQVHLEFAQYKGQTIKQADV
jgi:trehalose/maltose hydrolase-like predicted phosphorylase